MALCSCAPIICPSPRTAISATTRAIRCAAWPVGTPLSQNKCTFPVWAAPGRCGKPNATVSTAACHSAAGWGQRMVNVALEEAGIPVMEWDVDPVDANTWDEAKFRALVGEFIEKRIAR